MAFLRFSRDKRGYEHVYLVQPAGRRGKASPRILYWFRTPPNVKVGREPFDEDVRRSLEARYPDVAFNWPRLLATPFPPPDTERWRERRRERAARRAADADVEIVAGAPNPDSRANPQRESSSEDQSSAVSAGATDAPVVQGESAGERIVSGESQSVVPDEGPAAVTMAEPARRHRRRRRRRRRASGGDASPPGAPTVPETNPVDLNRSGDGD